ncbi:hypothetical protein KM043_014969 [Ampulex compressa]|nr:hypothetical protein KM043_014969 [Ampulex compressa]
MGAARSHWNYCARSDQGIWGLLVNVKNQDRDLAIDIAGRSEEVCLKNFLRFCGQVRIFENLERGKDRDLAIDIAGRSEEVCLKNFLGFCPETPAEPPIKYRPVVSRTTTVAYNNDGSSRGCDSAADGAAGLAIQPSNEPRPTSRQVDRLAYGGTKFFERFSSPNRRRFLGAPHLGLAIEHNLDEQNYSKISSANRSTTDHLWSTERFDFRTWPYLRQWRARGWAQETRIASTIDGNL